MFDTDIMYVDTIYLGLVPCVLISSFINEGYISSSVLCCRYLVTILHAKKLRSLSL